MNTWCSIKDVYDAYLDCKKRKSKSESCARFMANEAANIYQLWKDLNTGKYEIGYSDAFCVTRPKVREVFAADFRDRIVHHLVMLKLIPLFEKEFIPDTYNCRKGKGTDYGINKVAEFMRQHPNGWIVKCDLSCFFMNINKALLAEMLRKFINEKYQGEDKEEIQKLVYQIVMHRPELKCVKKGNLRLWDVLPNGKSLFTSDGNHGLAIGNLTSQIFANFYLHCLDLLLSSIPGICYGRYVDDFIIVGEDEKSVLAVLPKIREVLATIELTLHPRKVHIQPIRHGINFLGSTIKQNRLYAGNRTIGNLYNLINNYNHIKDKERFIEKFMQRYNSYMGYLIHRKTWKIRNRMFDLVDDETKKYVYMTDNMAVMKVRNEYKTINKLKLQYKHGKEYNAIRRMARKQENVPQERQGLVHIAC